MLVRDCVFKFMFLRQTIVEEQWDIGFHFRQAKILNLVN